MPQTVNTQDATNFLKNGYVSRTLASRDGAGNIKLSANVTSTENSTITVESVTSQFSTDTALKLFDTRFEYFKFPVQTVAASSLSNIGTNINQEAADALAGVSFEQDVISRRLELVPATAGASKEWPVQIRHGNVYIRQGESFHFSNHIYKGTESDFKTPDKAYTVNNRLYAPFLALKVGEDLRKSWLNPPLSGQTTTPNGFGGVAHTYLGWADGSKITPPLIGGNSPNKPGWVRITADMIKQLRAGGTIAGTSAYKRNIKLKVSVSWHVDDSANTFLSGKNVVIGGAKGAAADASLTANTVYKREWMEYVQNGAMLEVKLIPDAYYDDHWYSGKLVRFVQSTSNFPIGIPRDLPIGPSGLPQSNTTTTRLAPFKLNTARASLNVTSHNIFDMAPLYGPDYDAVRIDIDPVAHRYRTLSFEYVIDTRDLLKTEKGSNTPRGEYREFGLEFASNYKCIIDRCSIDVSVEELPSDINSNPAYGFSDTALKTTVDSQLNGNQFKYNRYRPLFGCTTDYSEKINGVQMVAGPNILCGDYFGSNNVVGFTGLNGSWYPLMTWPNNNGWVPKNKWAQNQGYARWGSSVGADLKTEGATKDDLLYNGAKYVKILDTPFTLGSK